ncbi:hypothetical protein [Prevotella sp. DNF00663]|uniref:hypothetical protein n=1 Tax=Prevotella sp. DNF00663 TaxID=1384078 RepID=UPI000A624A85|nr:hypothetical protein [Prevotella sp. DNF00663]
MKKKKLRPYMSPQCTIISLDNVPMLMSGSGPKPGAKMDTDHWGSGTSETPSSETNPNPTDEDWDWINKQP